MSKDDETVAMILGGFVGAALASPRPEEKQELLEYRNLKQEIALRQQRIGDFPQLPKLMVKPEYYNAFLEAYKMHLNGFFRGSAVISSALIEALLKDKFGNKKFYDLIEEANKNNLIPKSEYYFIHGVREERNNSAHNLLKEVREEDANLVLRLAIRIINKVL